MWRYVLCSCLALPAYAAGETPKAVPRPADPVFVAFYERGSAYADGVLVPEQQHFREHVEHLQSRKEWLIGGGPFAPRANDEGVGLVVFRAVGLTEAERWMAHDPAVVAGVFKVVVRQWQVGGIREYEETQRRE